MLTGCCDMKKILLVMGCIGMLGFASIALAQDNTSGRYSLGFRGGNLPDPEMALSVGTLKIESLEGGTKEEKWHGLAARMADRVWSALHYRRDLKTFPLKVFASNAQPFSLAFGDMLVSELVSRGLMVAVGDEPRALPLSFHSLLVPGPSGPAVVLNISLWHKKEQVVNVTNAFTVEEAAVSLYYSPNAPGNQVPVAKTRSVRMVSK